MNYSMKFQFKTTCILTGALGQYSNLLLLLFLSFFNKRMGQIQIVIRVFQISTMMQISASQQQELALAAEDTQK